MNYGRQESLRGGGICKDGHAFVPIAPSRGKAGYTDYHCSVCGEWKTMQADGGEAPEAALERRVLVLEQQVANLLAGRTVALPAPSRE